ncbi:MAG: hypothetical protein KUG77_19850 [Nannocystaceae bacterium]|nr:hypothetical protein [Nannocystaceae bacterium]
MSLDFDGAVVGGGGDIDGFVAKINRDGDAPWASGFHAPFANCNADITVDAFDNPTVVGSFGTPIAVGDFSFMPDSSNIFMATMEP